MNTRTCIFLLLISLLCATASPTYGRGRKGQLLLEHKENGEFIRVYSNYSREQHRVYLRFVNINRQYNIYYDLKGSNNKIWLTQAAFLPEREFDRINCEYQAINDTSGSIFSTTALDAKYRKDSLAGAPRIYLSQLEKDLLAQAIRQRIAAGPEKPEYYQTPVDPNSILFFVCVPTALR